MTQRHTIDSYRYLRILACASIILLHIVTGASKSYFRDVLTDRQLYASSVTMNFLMWGVPCFLMITGALLLDPERSLTTKKLFGKYLRRIVLALVSFTILFQVMDYAVGFEDSIFPGALLKILDGKSWAHMWYLYLMVFLYLMMPFFKYVADHASDAMMGYLILLMLVFGSALPALQGFGWDAQILNYTLVIYPVYLFLGHYIHKRGMKRSMAIGLLVLGSAGVAAMSVLQHRFPDYSDGFAQLTQYASPFVIAQASGIFALFDSAGEGGECPAIIVSMDQCTFGIYLIHMVFIRAFLKLYGLNPYTYGPFAFIAMTVVFFAVSYGITWLIRKIPKLNLL